MSERRPTARDGFVRGEKRQAAPGLWNRRTLVLVGVLGLAAVAVLAQFGENGILSLWDLEDRAAKLDGTVADLEVANDQLAEQIEAIDSDPAVLERIARERHNMRRPDEEVLTVLPAPQDD